ncbi:MAG: dipeptide epimerase [Candidatus Omnitrophica bacterium]|nr:dipeptide epimerase [Candidatus Omnitrophota bacterium]
MKNSYIKKTQVSSLRALLIQPFRTALGEHKTLENILFTIELVDGTKGFGEAAIATHITGETLEETFSNLEAIGRMLEGRDASDYLKISGRLHDRFMKNNAAVAAVECALLDALTRQWKIPLWKFFGSRPRRLVSDITIVIADLQETEESVKKFYRQGFRAFKVKIGRDEESDFQRVLAVKKHAPRCKIYLDANQGYSADQTLNFLKRLKRQGIKPALLEQPVPKADWEGLKRVARLTKVPICADESVSSLTDAVRVVKENAVPVINIKLMKFGLIHAREIAILAQANGIKLMIGGMMETSLAMTTAAHMAAGLGGFSYIDLDTPFFIQDARKNPYLNSKGIYELRKVKAGVGITL